MENRKDINSQLVQRKLEHDRKYYTQQVQPILIALQQNIDALLQALKPTSNKGAFLKEIFNINSMTIYFTDLRSHFNQIIKAGEPFIEINCPDSLPDICKQKAAFTALSDQLKQVEALLTAHPDYLYPDYNYDECYGIYQILQAISLSLAKSFTSLTSELPTSAEHDVIASESLNLKNILIKLQHKYDDSLATDMDVSETLNAESAQIVAAPTVNADSAQIVAAPTVTAIPDPSPTIPGTNYLDSLPNEMLHRIASYLGDQDLVALAMSEKKLGARLLPLFKAANKSLQFSDSSHTNGKAYFLLTSNELFGWGDNSYGQLGLGHTQEWVDHLTPIPGLSGKILQILPYDDFTIVLTTTGLFGSGSNRRNRLGLGSQTDVTHFTQLPGLTRQAYTDLSLLLGNDHTIIPGLSGQILKIFINDEKSILVHTTHGLFGCGKNHYGELGLGDTKEVFQFTLIPGLSGGILDVFAEDITTLVLTTKGLFGSGYNKNGCLGLGDKEKVTQFTLIPGLPGEILQVHKTDERTNVHRLSPRLILHFSPPKLCSTFVLTTSGLFGCGRKNFGLGNKKDITRFTPIAGVSGQILKIFSNLRSTFVFTTEGLFGCGYNKIIGLHPKLDGHIVSEFSLIPGLKGQILDVIAECNFTFVVTTQGLFACGLNDYGQLGLGHNKDVSEFTQISGLPGQILKVARIPFMDTTMVLTTEGLFFSGEVGGDRRYVNRFIPSKIPGEVKSYLSQVRVINLLENGQKPKSSQSYLKSGKAVKLGKEEVEEKSNEITTQKQTALTELEKDINSVKKMEDLYGLFTAVKEAKTGMLRQDRNGLFGDTHSYRLAIQALAEKALKKPLPSYSQSELKHDILAEALRCKAPGADWKNALKNLKISALEKFQAELAQQKNNLTGILALSKMLMQDKNLMRFERINFFQAYGNTRSYKAALQLLAHAVIDTLAEVSDEANKPSITHETLPLLCELLLKLKEAKSFTDTNWQETIDKLQQQIMQQIDTENKQSRSIK